MDAGERITIEATGDPGTLYLQGYKTQSASVPGSVGFKVSSTDTYIVFAYVDGQGTNLISVSCGPDGDEGGGTSSGSGSSEPKAGPPCDNLYDGRINDNQGLDCAAPIAIYLHSIDIFGIDPNTGSGLLVMSINDDILKGPIPTSNTLLSEGTNILTGQLLRVYWLSASNEIEVITAYADGKPYIVAWPVGHPERFYHLMA